MAVADVLRELAAARLCTRRQRVPAAVDRACRAVHRAAATAARAWSAPSAGWRDGDGVGTVVLRPAGVGGRGAAVASTWRFCARKARKAPPTAASAPRPSARLPRCCRRRRRRLALRRRRRSLRRRGGWRPLVGGRRRRRLWWRWRDRGGRCRRRRGRGRRRWRWRRRARAAARCAAGAAEGEPRLKSRVLLSLLEQHERVAVRQRDIVRFTGRLCSSGHRARRSSCLRFAAGAGAGVKIRRERCVRPVQLPTEVSSPNHGFTAERELGADKFAPPRRCWAEASRGAHRAAPTIATSVDFTPRASQTSHRAPPRPPAAAPT